MYVFPVHPLMISDFDIGTRAINTNESLILLRYKAWQLKLKQFESLLHYTYKLAMSLETPSLHNIPMIYFS